MSFFSCNCGEQDDEKDTPWNVVVSSISLPKKIRPGAPDLLPPNETVVTGAEIGGVRLSNSKDTQLSGLPLLIFIVSAAVFVGIVVSGFTAKPDKIAAKPSLW